MHLLTSTLDTGILFRGLTSRTHCLDHTSHSLTVPSRDPETSVVLSTDENDNDTTALVCPWSTAHSDDDDDDDEEDAELEAEAETAPPVRR